jgi:hypothetical protein
MDKYRIEYKLIFGNGTKSGTNVMYVEAESQQEAELDVMARNEHETVAGIDIIQVSVD